MRAWPPLVPSAVLVESVSGRQRDDAVSRLLKTCDVSEECQCKMSHEKVY